MALPHRKFLFAEPEKTSEFDRGFSPNCYMCYVCPDSCFISSPPPQLSPIDDPGKNHVSTVLILMLCILGVSFFVLSYLTISRYRNSRRRNPENRRESGFLENQGPVSDHHIWYIRSVGLPQSLIDSIALFPYKNGDGLIDGHDCSVCLSDFQENESLRLLPKCSHAFHAACIDTWLRSHKNCPVCRAPILLGTGSSSGNPETRSETRQTDRIDETGSRGVMPIREDQTAKIPSVDGGIGGLRVLGDLRVRDDGRELRRSVSLDFSAASMTWQEISDNAKVEKQNLEKRDRNNLVKSGSHVQKGAVSMKRSFSLSGKRKNSRSLESIQIPEISLRNCGR